MEDISYLKLYKCAGDCNRKLPSAIDISKLLGKGKGAEYFDRGEALAYDERAWEYACTECFGDTGAYK